MSKNKSEDPFFVLNFETPSSIAMVLLTFINIRSSTAKVCMYNCDQAWQDLAPSLSKKLFTLSGYDLAIITQLIEHELNCLRTSAIPLECE